MAKDDKLKAGQRALAGLLAAEVAKAIADEVAGSHGEGSIWGQLGRMAQRAAEIGADEEVSSYRANGGAGGFLGHFQRAAIEQAHAGRTAPQIRQAQQKAIARSYTPEEFYAFGRQAEDAGDDVKAFKLYNAAAHGGYEKAMNDLAVCYEEGRGTSADMTEAIRWYQRAAEAGHRGAQFNLATVLDTQGFLTIGEKAREGAAGWYLKAALQDHVKAQAKLAEYYLEGLGGLPQSRADARTWLRLAASGGHTKAAALLRKMDEDDAAAEKTRADEKAQAKAPPTPALPHGANPHLRGSRPWAFHELGLPEVDDKPTIKAAYRRLMRLAHPDHGGDTEFAADLNLARQVLLD